MRIDVIGTRGFPGIQGGVERHCERLYPQMKGVSVRVFRRKPYVKTQQSQYSGISFTDLPSTRISGFETVLHSLLATLISMFSKAEIVHIHNIGPAMFAPLLRAVGKKWCLLTIAQTMSTTNGMHLQKQCSGCRSGLHWRRPRRSFLSTSSRCRDIQNLSGVNRHISQTVLFR